VEATFRGHRGIILVMQFLKEKGPFCRDCGLAVFRSMTSNTLVQGWWGYASFVITPFVVVWNLITSLKVRGLAPRSPSPEHPSVPALDPGRPLYLRWGMIGLLVPVAVAAAATFAVISSAPENKVGQCVSATRTTDVDFVDCAEPNDGRIIATVRDESLCPTETTHIVEETTSRRGRTPVPTGTLWCVVGAAS
jgi:hypothetical protein